MEKKQQFCVSGSCLPSKKTKNPEKRKECGEVFTGLPLFTDDNFLWFKKSKTCSSIVASTTPVGVKKELKLFHENWVSMPESRNKESAEELERRVAFNLRRMISSYSWVDLQEERSRGVSTQLSLYHHDPFKIKKKMTRSDLGFSCRLLVSSDLVETHILPFLNKDQIKQVVGVGNQENQETKSGLKVWVWDMNTETIHQLVFKRWGSSKTYIFNDGWTKYFVKRRNLIEGDQIGLFWDIDHSRFHFSVLTRAAAVSA
ncbi:unnamed protein product [Dovyalis caffra]|uniref:TF-B3 domain-containing protein n=1 Tax=Dovyalis caffra TaxID=77055 RepID=A0AAV1SID7_9ROSI|nr:unnamed protein product [Dovyalis caffra]